MHGIAQELRRFGLTPGQYDQMMADQNDVCALCKNPEVVAHPGQSVPIRLAVDHDHRTGKVRGLLCAKCNTGLHRIEKLGAEWALLALVYLDVPAGTMPAPAYVGTGIRP